MSADKFARSVACMSSETVEHRGRSTAKTTQIGEEMRNQYLHIMWLQSLGRARDWFKTQLGGEKTRAAISEALNVKEATPRSALTVLFQGKVYIYESNASIFMGRQPGCDILATDGDISFSRVSAILYPQTDMLLICDPGNLSGIVMDSRANKEEELGKSLPRARTMLKLGWGERAEITVCGQKAIFFPVEEDKPKACIVCMDANRACLFKPCRHQICCIDCTSKLMNTTKKCPMCNQEIEGTTLIHNPIASFATHS